MSFLSKIFSNNDNSQEAPKVPSTSNLLNLPEFIRETIQSDIYDNKLYELGIEQGNLLIEKETQLKAIEGKYNGFIQFLQEAKRKEVEKAKIEAEIIQKEVENLDIALNEFIEDSEISTLKKQIEKIEEQLKGYDEELYEDSFLTEASKLAEEEIKTEKNNIKLLLDEYNVLRETMAKEVKSIKFLLSDLEKSNLTADQREGILKKIKSVIKEEYPLTISKLKDLEELAEDVLNIKGEQIENSYKYLDSYISQLKPKIFRRSQIIIYYLMSFIIFIGEFYLIYNFTTDVLMPASKPNFIIDYFLNPIYLAVIGFCIALPLAIGMIFKLFLKEYPQGERARFLRWWILFPLGVLAVIGLVAISIPNSIQILQESGVPIGTDGVNGIETVFGFPPNEIKLIGIMIFSPILTLILSIVGAVLFLYALEMHKDFSNAKKMSLLKIDWKWLKINVKSYKKSLEEKKENIAQKIEGLKLKQENKHRDLAEAKANCTSHSDSDFYVGMVSNYKETAINYFIAGHERGVAETSKNWGELDILLFKARKKLSNKK